MELNLKYPTHTIVISNDGMKRYTSLRIFIEDYVYRDIFNTLISDNSSIFNFVENERQLINNFVQSLIGFHNNQKQSLFTDDFISFKDEQEFFIFCIINDIEFEEQLWFNTVYIRTDPFTSLMYIQNASIKLIQLTYPDFYYKPKSGLDELIERVRECLKEKDLIESKYKCDPNKYQKFLADNEIFSLYHFTSTKNKDSIQQYGIYSFDYIKELGIKVAFSSSSESQYYDIKKGLSDYVHLGFERKHPMLFRALGEGRLYDYFIFEISPSVIFLRDTLYSDRNALKNNARISSDINFFLQIPFNRFHNQNYLSLDEEDRAYFQSEILVKHCIDKSYILNLSNE